MIRLSFRIALIFALLLAACSPPPGNSTGPALSPTALKYRLLDQFPDLFFCDPDYFPVAQEDETELARRRFPELVANSEEFNAILARHQLMGQDTFSDEQKLLIYRDHKKLAAIPLTQTEDRYEFQIQSAKTEGNGELITGTIDRQGKIVVEERNPSIATCPICLAGGTQIDTPDGPILVQDLQVGSRVWTANRSGMRVAAPVLRVSRTAVPADHQVVHLALADGRELWVSAGHPTADGRVIGQFKAGDLLDGAPVRSAGRVAYTGTATYDLLPAGETGFYWANGILVSSTLTMLTSRFRPATPAPASHSSHRPCWSPEKSPR